MESQLLDNGLNLLRIANKYRVQNTDRYDFISSLGYILIYDNAPYGWRNKVRDPQTEKPNTYLIGLNLDDIYQAKGGNDNVGAKDWIKMEYQK